MRQTRSGVANRFLELPTRGRSGPGRGGQQLRRALNGFAPRGPAKLWRAGVLSGLIVETTATWDVVAQGFVLHTPSDTAAKNWISQGYTLGIISKKVVSRVFETIRGFS